MFLILILLQQVACDHSRAIDFQFMQKYSNPERFKVKQILMFFSKSLEVPGNNPNREEGFWERGGT
ncbi:hypothetical protein E2C01_025822 [Portunus trituberculatus]|uniref:Uncharacterized protein n=1 Tax=Portunus trituberculatus TaxID=210409 RepID=A0A5B7EGZ4_PORTR|nr:hypothetical protein [Portunus trituberculatus]